MASKETGTIAGRYASALFDLAEEQKALDQVADDLRGLRDMVAASPDLRRLVRSPVLTRAEQARGIMALAEKAGMADLTRRFLGVVADNRRLFVLPAIIESYLAALAARRGETTAQVMAAAPLGEKHLQALTEALKAMIGGKVTVDVKVDPDLLGGMVVQVGSRLIDSSLRTKLQQLKLAMKGVG